MSTPTTVSLTASLDRQELISCIEDRARAFPGYDSTGGIKPLVVQRYGVTNQYKDHYDWFPDGPYIDGKDIESTFFVYIKQTALEEAPTFRVKCTGRREVVRFCGLR